MIYAKVRYYEPFTVFHSPNIAHAIEGFRQMGAEIKLYQKIDEIYDKVTKEDIVLDYIDQCLTIFNKFGVSPYCTDYPLVLYDFLGRKIWTDTINNINRSPELWNVFVKPFKDKAFTGRIIRSPKDLIGCGSAYENYSVFVSEIVDIKREWRGFIYYDELIDIRPYSGDWHYNYDADTIDAILEAFRTMKDRPNACSLDFAVIEYLDKDNYYLPKEKTIFLEMNDAYALGNYGLNCIDYAKMISARWSQLLGVSDKYDFRRG